MFRPSLKKSVKKIRKAGESGSMQMHELWLAVASSGERPWWSVFFECRGRKLRNISGTCREGSRCPSSAINQMIEDIQERVPSATFRGAGTAYHGHFEIPDVFGLTIR